jgi:hypothetical protein
VVPKAEAGTGEDRAPVSNKTSMIRSAQASIRGLTAVRN